MQKYTESQLASEYIKHESRPNSSAGTTKKFRTRFIYSTDVQPAEIEAAMAFRLKKTMGKNSKEVKIKSKTFRASTGSVQVQNDRKDLSYCLSKCERSTQIASQKTNNGVCDRSAQNMPYFATGVQQVGTSNSPVHVSTSAENNTKVLVVLKMNSLIPSCMTLGANFLWSLKAVVFSNNGSNLNLHSGLFHMMNR